MERSNALGRYTDAPTYSSKVANLEFAWLCKAS